MLLAQQGGARRLPHYLGLRIGHKTGDIAPVVANDVGIAYHASGPIVVSFFVNEITGSYGEAEDQMGAADAEDCRVLRSAVSVFAFT
jgi:hypothetical protein